MSLDLFFFFCHLFVYYHYYYYFSCISICVYRKEKKLVLKIGTEHITFLFYKGSTAFSAGIPEYIYSKKRTRENRKTTTNHSTSYEENSVKMGCAPSSEFEPPPDAPELPFGLRDQNQSAFDNVVLMGTPGSNMNPSRNAIKTSGEPSSGSNPVPIKQLKQEGEGGIVPSPPPPREEGAAAPFLQRRNVNSGSNVSPLAYPTSKNEEVTGMKLLGKEKYIVEYGAIAMDDDTTSFDNSNQGPDSGARISTSRGTLLLFCDFLTENVVLSYRDAATGSIFARSYTDQELTEAKESAGIPFSWGSFFKSIASSVLKSKAGVLGVSSNERREIAFTITSSKEPGSYTFRVNLPLVSDGQHPDPKMIHYYMAEPLTRVVVASRARIEANPKEREASKMECELSVCTASIRKYKATIDRLLPLIRPLREESAIRSHAAMTSGRAVRDMERMIRVQRDCQTKKHPLDSVYEDGGAQYFQHVPWSVEHHPHEEEPDDTLSACIRELFPLSSGKSLDTITSILDRPDLKKIMEFNDNRQVVTEALEIFKGIDRWDYDTIQLEIITNGNALFYTTYLLIYKLDLARIFNIDDQVLRNFLVAVQSAYHPNPYHNAMHGADVTQINYYIMMVAGLAQKCKLSNEEILAGLIAGAVHDFDHPGLNNNFHTRTNAYLATLYNDRSILENHHIACTFELLRHPRYNILASLSEEQRLSVRETMVEMVLATDMGNHAKIFKQFQARLAEVPEWHAKKEDVRLALSMSIKMADISNCARPNHIYAEWAKNISKEFYLQGDAERQLNLSISPFMDRTKEEEEFPKGQISFMMYIVQPMVEVLAEFLPSLSFALNLCRENKQYWTRLQKD